MKTGAVIGVVQDDGRILAARVAQAGGRALHRILARNYASRTRATMLVSLGEITAVGATPRDSRLPEEQGEPALVDPCGFEAMRGTAAHAHLFDDGGSWTHWSDRVEAAATFTIDEE